MCGMVGFISKWSSGFLEREIKVFEEMLFVDTLRGEDATGICAINKLYGATVLKEAVAAPWFVYDKDYDEERKTWTKDLKAVLGHNRKATMGGRKDEQAHPFTFQDRYVFFHNGTLNSHKHLADTDVDSEALGQHLVVCEGDVDKLATALQSVHGAYACVWYDADKNTVYFLRNSQRPLSLITTEDGSITYASEAWMAAGPLSRAGMKVENITNLEPDTLYSIDLTPTTCKIKEEKLPKKAPAPTFQGTPIGMPFTKREARGLINEFKTSSYIGIFPDDAIHVGISAEPHPQEVCDWLVFGSSPEYEGVVFKFILKDKFKHEVDDLLTGRYITGTYEKSEYRKATLEVWLNNIHWSKQGQVCH